MEVPEYTHERFSIAGVLSELTHEVKQKGLEPFEAFVVLRQELGTLGLRHTLAYASTSITTGGHARRMAASPANDVLRITPLTIGDVIAANTRTAQLMIAQLERKGDVEAKDVILPVDLGNTGWNQTEFMKFWALVIGVTNLEDMTGHTLQGLVGLEHELEEGLARDGVDVELMSSKTASLDDRRPEYYRFVDSYARTLRGQRVQPEPVRRFIQLVDTGISLGCDAERRLANDFGVPAFKLAPMRPATIDEATADVPLLQEDLRIITAYGGEVAIASKGSSLTLVRSL